MGIFDKITAYFFGGAPGEQKPDQDSGSQPQNETGTLSVYGNQKVRTLKEAFKAKFGVGIRVYKGRKFADDNATLASVSVNASSIKGVFRADGSTKVGDAENLFKNSFGITIQIENAAGDLADNDETLEQQKA